MILHNILIQLGDDRELTSESLNSELYTARANYLQIETFPIGRPNEAKFLFRNQIIGEFF